MSAAIDAAHIERQKVWSKMTFGPGARTQGIVEHIASELTEILEEPDDLYEWVDVIILALDGAWRAGHDSQEIINAIIRKQTENELRQWPDWREHSEDHPIEHIREIS